MKIKDFFENYIYSDFEWVYVFRGEYLVHAQEIGTREEFNDFINDFGDEKVKDWKIREYEEVDYISDVLFYLK